MQAKSLKDRKGAGNIKHVENDRVKYSLINIRKQKLSKKIMNI